MQFRQFVIVVTALALATFGLLFVMPGMVGIERLPHSPQRSAGVLGAGTPAGAGGSTSGPNGATSTNNTAGPTSTRSSVGPDGQTNEEVMSMGNLGVSVGHVLGLWPGRSVPLPVTYTNPQSFAVAVVSATVEVTSATSPTSSTADTTGSPAPGCSPGNLEVPQGTLALSRPVVVGPRSSVSSSVPVRLARDAPDACKGSSFTVTVTATAEDR